MEKVTKSPFLRLNGAEFHKGARNGFISILGGGLGWFVFSKLGIEVSPDTLAAIESISVLVGAIVLHYLNYFLNAWRV